MDSFIYLVQLIQESWLLFDTPPNNADSTSARRRHRLCVNPERVQRITTHSRQLGKHYYSPYYLSRDVNDVLTTLAEDGDLRIPPNALAPTLVEHLLPDGLDGVALLRLCTVEHGIHCAQTGPNRYTITAQISLARGIPLLFELVAHMILVTRRTLEKTCCDFTIACALIDANSIPTGSTPIDSAQPFTTREFLVESSHGVRTHKGKPLHEALGSLPTFETAGYIGKEQDDITRTSSTAETHNPPIETPQAAQRESFETALTRKILEQLRQHPNDGVSMPALYNQLSSFFAQCIASCMQSLQKDGLATKKDSLHYIANDVNTRDSIGDADSQTTNNMAQPRDTKSTMKPATASVEPIETLLDEEPCHTLPIHPIDSHPLSPDNAEPLWEAVIKAVATQDDSVSALLADTHVKLDDGKRLFVSFPRTHSLSKQMASADKIITIIKNHVKGLFGDRDIVFTYDDQPVPEASHISHTAKPTDAPMHATHAATNPCESTSDAASDDVQSLDEHAAPATPHAIRVEHLGGSASSSPQQTPQDTLGSPSPRSASSARAKETHEHTTRILPEFAPFEFNTKAGAAYFLTLLGVTAPDICEILKINQSQYHLLRQDGFEMASHPFSYDERCHRDVGLCNRLNNLRQSDKRLLIQFFTHKIAYNPGCNRSMEECRHIEALDRIFDTLGLYHDKQEIEAAPRSNAAPHSSNIIVNSESDGIPADSSCKRRMLPSHPDYPMASLDEPACPSNGMALPLCFWPYPFKRLDHRLLFCHLLGGGKYKIAKAFGITAQKYGAQLEKVCFSTPLVKNAVYRTKRYYYRVDSAKINLGRAQQDCDPVAFAASLPKPVKDYLLCWLLGDDESQIAAYMEVPVSDIPSYKQQLARLQLAWANGSARHTDKPVTQVPKDSGCQAHEKADAPLNTPSRTTQTANVAAIRSHEQPHRSTHRIVPGHLPPAAKPFPSLTEYPMASADQQQEPMTGKAIPLEYWPYPFAEQSDQAFFLLLLGANNGEISRMLNVTWHAAGRLTENARLRHRAFTNAIAQHKTGHANINIKQLDLAALHANHDPLGFIASLMTPQKQFLLHWIMGDDDSAIAKALNINADRIPAYHLAIIRAQNDWLIERKTNASARPASHAEARGGHRIAATKPTTPTEPFSADSAPALKSTTAPNAAAPSYNPRAAQASLFQIGISDKPKEAAYRVPVQEQLFTSGPTQTSLFDQQEIPSQGHPVCRGTVIAAPITYSEWLRTLDDFTASVVSAKIEEGSYASVAQKAQATHRQCRLAYDEAMKSMPRLVEQQYLYLMETYDIDEPRFAKLTGLASGSYRYLLHIRKQRGVRSLDQYGGNDSKLPLSLRNKLKGKNEDAHNPASNPLNMVRVGDSCVRKTFRHVATELGKQLTAAKAVTVGQFQREYIRVLNENRLAAQALLSNPDNSQAFMQALGNTNSFLMPTKDSIRYYDYAAHDLSLIASMLRKEAPRNIECSTALLFDEHRALMDRLDIRNPNELHTVIKRVVHDCRLRTVAINKIPLITLGEAQRRDQVLAIIKEISPCSADEIANEYQERYGVNANTVKSSYLREFQAYRKDGRYEYRDTALTGQQLDSLRKMLVNDCHALSSIKSRYVAANPGASALDITDEKLTLAGYYSSHGLAIRKGLEPKRLFSERIDRHQQFKAGDPGFEDDVMKHPAFRSELTSRLNSYAYVQPEPNFYLSVSWLQSRFGVTADMLRDYGEQVASQAEPGVPFNVHSLAKSGFLHEVDLLREEADFKDCFYETLIEALPAWRQIKRTSFEGTKVYCLSESSFSISDIIKYIAQREGAIELESLLDLLKDEYAITTSANYLRGCIERTCQDAGVFYNQQFETLLPNKEANGAFLLSQING